MHEQPTEIGVLFSARHGRPVRSGSLHDQRGSTFELIVDAIGARKRDLAASLVRFCRDSECGPRQSVQRRWREQLRTLLVHTGASSEEVRSVEARLLGLLALPGGEPFSDGASERFVAMTFDELATLCRSAQWESARTAALKARDTWQLVHDREIDWTYGLMTEYVRREGEEAAPGMFRAIDDGHFAQFLALADPRTLDWATVGVERVLLDTLEVMRSHLSTRDRGRTPLDVEELPDRWVLRFDPCGSGGRAFRSDPIEGTAPRAEPPYELGVVQRAYDWTDQKAGVCLYCAHCLEIYEHRTMDEAGFPYLVVEPPTYEPERPDLSSSARCTYTIYKDSSAVPDAIYRRCGRRKPGSHA
jgi:hypothetical protein